jgi:hypothetical protein
LFRLLSLSQNRNPNLKRGIVMYKFKATKTRKPTVIQFEKMNRTMWDYTIMIGEHRMIRGAVTQERSNPYLILEMILEKTAIQELRKSNWVPDRSATDE